MTLVLPSIAARLTKVLLKRREFTPEIATKSAHLTSVRSITGAYLQPGFVDCNGKGVYRGANPPEGALLTVWIKEFTGDEIRIEITKVTGQPVANLKAPGAPARFHAIELGSTSDQRRQYRVWW